jgi:hypothetical protein
MDTSTSRAVGLTRTPVRGWMVVLLSRLQASSIVLTSYSFGVFLPFISRDLHLSPLEAGLLQRAWWVTSALLSLPCSVWFSRVRPAPLVLVSLLLGLPFLVLQGLARTFLSLFLARFFFVLCHLSSTPARPLLLQQWAAPSQYALLNAVGLSLHSLLMAAALSSSAWLIAVVGSWRLVYGIHGAFLALQTVAWWVVACEDKAPVQGLTHALAAPQPTPLRALRAYPQGWLLGLTMLALSGDLDGPRHVSPDSAPGAARHAARPQWAAPGLFILWAHSLCAPWRRPRKTGAAPKTPPMGAGAL